MEIHIEPIELVFLLLAAAVALTYLARRLRIAEPILLLFGGLAIGLIPGLPPIELQKRITEFGLPVSGEILGQTDLGPNGIKLLQQLVSGRRVTFVEDGWRDGDPPGRRYAYVFLPDKRLVNLELIKRGFAYADRLGSHPRRDEFIAVEAGARRQKLGVWAQ